MKNRPTLAALYGRLAYAHRNLSPGTKLEHTASGGVYEVVGYAIREADNELLINYSNGLVTFSRPYKEMFEKNRPEGGPVTRFVIRND